MQALYKLLIFNYVAYGVSLKFIGSIFEEHEGGLRTMKFEWFDASAAVDIGTELANQFAPDLATSPNVKNAPQNEDKAILELLRRADREVRSLRLNVYKRAKFANSFKWRLLENGIAAATADRMTQSLLLHLSLNKNSTMPVQKVARAARNPADVGNAEYFFNQGNKQFAQGAYDEAIASYKNSIETRPDYANALANLGAALCKVGRYKEAGNYLRQAIEIQPDIPEALSNFGTLLLWVGQHADAVNLLRRALKLKPKDLETQYSLGLALISLGRSRDARARFQKILRVAPRHADATYGMGQVARMDGRFDEAEALFRRALELKPKMTGPLAAVACIRKMQSSDHSWLERAEAIAASGITPLQEADLRFAIGKYWDDLGEFARAFENYQCANGLQKSVADDYDRKARVHFVDDLKRVYTRENLDSGRHTFSNSTKPVFVVGMMRSGTSLVEQIIASHPAARGAGELDFWSSAVVDHETALRQGLLAAPLRTRLADQYLRFLSEKSMDALRVVDKAPVNSDYLGVIHSVFPNARIVYMKRNPIDTCLSCYFQQFSPAHNFAMDLSDLAHYYREHHRLFSHWRTILPAETILVVPYEELVAEQEEWTRRILDFLGLKWDARCLQFHETKRQVATASSWQVRQKIFADSIGRWRNYEKFIGPLRSLADLSP